MRIKDKFNTNSEMAAKDLEGGVKDSELWAKSLERCEGDEAKAWEFYYLYQDFLKDLEGGVDRLELWKKTLKRCEGDNAKAEELYSLYRNIDLATNKSVNIMFNIKEKLDFYIKYDEIDLYFECIAAIEDKGYSLKADGTGGLVIYKSSILLRRRHVIARVTTLKELCKLVEDTNLEELYALGKKESYKTYMRRNKDKHFYFIALPIVYLILYLTPLSNPSQWDKFFIGLILVVVAVLFVAPLAKFDNESFTVER